MDDRPQIGCVEDLATLTKLDEQILLEELQERYRKDLIYTYVGDILIAVNPFKQLNIYGKKEAERYKNAKKSSNAPHIFAVADMAFQSISGYGGLRPKDQCILISGESGAGKTESTKLIIKQLIELSQGKSQLEQQILQVNPLLEAFGNAQTQMNDNSSRFGKYIQLRFLDGQVKGAKISEYLLEKSRVVGQHEEEENFHIFYYLFGGQTCDSHFNNLHLKDPNDFRYLTNGVNHFKSQQPRLMNQYKELLNSMDLVGFTDEEQAGLFTMIAGILHLGNIQFQTVEDSDETLISNPRGALQTAANLLSIDATELQECLTSVVTVTRGEYIKKYYDKSKASDCRDALSKAIYGRLFGWIVNKINQLLAPEMRSGKVEYREIGILDIFGFEHFEKNSFEQACINLANEQLQFFFNQHIFKMEQEEYIKEGIDWTEIKFVDNKPLLDMFLAKPVGILSLLDEESQFPKATDKTFVDKLNHNFGKNPNYHKSLQNTRPYFTIQHYAGKVTYDTSQWLEKNRDTLPEGITEIMKASKNPLIKTLFKAEISRTGTLALQGRKSTRSRNTKGRHGPVKISTDAKRKATVGAKFKRSLNMLMEKMTKSSPIFVRCLKPNHNKHAGEFNTAYIQAQLLYTGMLETTKIRREGFAIRPPFEEFVERYKILIHKLKLKGTSTNCMEILKSTGMTGWHIGKTKVFLKYWHIERMADIMVKFGKAAVQLQKIVRGFLARNEFKRRKIEAERKAAELARLALLIEQQNAALAAEQARQKEMNKQNTKDKVIYGGGGIVPPAFPDGVNNGRHSLSIGTQSDLSKPTSLFTQGTQMDEQDSSDSDDVLNDIFVAFKDNDKYGTPGTKEATLGWFAETQTEHVFDHNEGVFAEWFHGIISRRDAEKLLQNKPVGCFLIRVSESRFGYSLSFKVEDRCRHYMIDQLKNGKFIICGENKVHRSLHDMVEYYQKNKISNYDGYLTIPCGQAHGECDYTELLNDQVYHILEETARNGQYYKVPPKRNPNKERPVLPPPRKSNVPLYSLEVSEEFRNRLIPNQIQHENPRKNNAPIYSLEVSEEFRNRLIQNQNQQHENPESSIFSAKNKVR